jgi:hypothetical protein
MILLGLNFLTLTIKLFIISWFTYDKIFVKICLIILLLALLWILYFYPKPLLNTFDVILKHYKIETNLKKYRTFFTILIYYAIFIIGILFLRITNVGKTFNLKEAWKTLYFNIINNSASINTINIILFILIIISYIILLMKITYYFKRLYVKLHLYYVDDLTNWYNKYIIRQFNYKYSYESILTKLCWKYPNFMEKYIIGFPIQYHIKTLGKKIHYVTLLLIILYDMIHNNWTLEYTYNVLPYIFIYDIYIKFCLFYDRLDYIHLGDFFAHSLLYSKNVLVFNDDDIIINALPCSPKFVAAILFVYIKYNLDGKLLSYVLDGPEYYENNFYQYNYYKDWKKRKK